LRRAPGMLRTSWAGPKADDAFRATTFGAGGMSVADIT
jgi:hypothetical protein